MDKYEKLMRETIEQYYWNNMEIQPDSSGVYYLSLSTESPMDNVRHEGLDLEVDSGFLIISTDLFSFPYVKLADAYKKYLDVGCIPDIPSGYTYYKMPDSPEDLCIRCSYQLKKFFKKWEEEEDQNKVKKHLKKKLGKLFSATLNDRAKIQKAIHQYRFFSQYMYRLVKELYSEQIKEDCNKLFKFWLELDDYTNPHVYEAETIKLSFEDGRVNLTAYPFELNSVENTKFSKCCLKKSRRIPLIYEYEMYYDPDEGEIGMFTSVDLWPSNELKGREFFNKSEKEVLTARLEKAVDNIVIDCELLKK